MSYCCISLDSELLLRFLWSAVVEAYLYCHTFRFRMKLLANAHHVDQILELSIAGWWFSSNQFSFQPCLISQFSLWYSMTIPFFTFSIIAGIVAIFSATSAQRVELLSLQKKMLSKSEFVIDAWYIDWFILCF